MPLWDGPIGWKGNTLGAGHTGFPGGGGPSSNLGGGNGGGLAAPDVTTIPPLLGITGDSWVGGSSPNYTVPFAQRLPILGNVRIRNAARPGSYSSVQLANFQADVLNYNPDAVLIAGGNNDLAGADYTISAATSDGSAGKGIYNIRGMIDLALATASVKRINVAAIRYGATGSQKTQSDWMNAQLRADITQPGGLYYGNPKVNLVDFNATITDLTTGLKRQASFFLADNVHPTDEGGRNGSFGNGFGTGLWDLLCANGTLRNVEYPWTRNQSTNDLRNIIKAIATFQGTIQGNGLPANWGLTAGGGVVPSIVANGAIAPSVGNALKLVFPAGNTGSAFISSASTSLVAYRGRKIGFMCRTKGTGMEAANSKVQIKAAASGTTATAYPFLYGNGTFLGAGSIDGDMFHYGECVVDPAATTLTVTITATNGNGAADSEVLIYDLVLIDLGAP